MTDEEFDEKARKRPLKAAFYKKMNRKTGFAGAELDRQEDLGLEFLWEEHHPSVADWLRRIQARPAYKMAYYPGCRLSEIYPELTLGRGSRRHLLDRAAARMRG
jgi:hypothetical protein